MGIWHQIANATATLAFAISLFMVSQMYVASRLSAGELGTVSISKLRIPDYRTPRDL